MGTIGHSVPAGELMRLVELHDHRTRALEEGDLFLA
jgi:hypothetical protein